MVGLPRFNHYRNTIDSLPALLLSLCKDFQNRYNVQFDVHIQPDLKLNGYSVQAANLLSTALEQAAFAAAPGSTVDIAIHQTRRGLEVEVVASTSEVSDESLRAFCREKTIVGVGQTVSLFRARCADGAIAWIVVQSGLPKIRLSA